MKLKEVKELKIIIILFEFYKQQTKMHNLFKISSKQTNVIKYKSKPIIIS